MPEPQEIIEFPSVIVNCRTGRVEDCFQTYVRPTHNQQLTQFCKDLTGIQQSQVDNGVPLSEALALHDQWLEAKGVKRSNFAVVTWSDWDCKIMLENECKVKNITKPQYFNSWINLKIPFGEMFGNGRCNLRTAVERAGLIWEGRAHCGLDDAKNTARLLLHLMACGTSLSITNSISSEPSDHPVMSDQPEQSASGMTEIYIYQPHIYCYCGMVSKLHNLPNIGAQVGGFYWGCGNCTENGPGCDFFQGTTDVDLMNFAP